MVAYNDNNNNNNNNNGDNDNNDNNNGANDDNNNNNNGDNANDDNNNNNDFASKSLKIAKICDETYFEEKKLTTTKSFFCDTRQTKANRSLSPPWSEIGIKIFALEATNAFVFRCGPILAFFPRF